MLVGASRIIGHKISEVSASSFEATSEVCPRPWTHPMLVNYLVLRINRAKLPRLFCGEFVDLVTVRGFTHWLLKESTLRSLCCSGLHWLAVGVKAPLARSSLQRERRCQRLQIHQHLRRCYPPPQHLCLSTLPPLSLSQIRQQLPSHLTRQIRLLLWLLQPRCRRHRPRLCPRRRRPWFPLTRPLQNPSSDTS